MRAVPALLALGAGGLVACAGILGYDRATLVDELDGAPVGEADAGTDAALDANVGDGSYAALILADRPSGYWRLDEDDDANIARDELGQHPAMVQGKVTFVDAGVAGRAARIGAGGTLFVGDAFDFPGTTPYTVEAWAQPNIVDLTFSNIAVKHLDGGTGFALYYRHDPPAPDIVEMEQHWAGGTRFCGAAVDIKVLTHVVLTYEKGLGPQIFLNGRLLSAVPGHDEDGGPPDTTEPFQWATSYFGILDELAIYDHVLTPAQIDAHYRKGTGKE